MAEDTPRAARTLPPGITPRLLTVEQAAAYCNVGRDNFAARVGVSPIRAFGNRVLYDRHALDRWLDQQSGIVAVADTDADGRVDWAKVLA